MKLNKVLFFALTAAFLLTALPALAAILPACATDVNAVLQLSCFLTLLIGVSQWILGITGSLALLFFVYGGFVFLTSRGASDQVQKGKTILTQATIGIIIIFGAYLAISFLVGNVLKAKFTTTIPKEATPTQTPAPTQQNTLVPGAAAGAVGGGVGAIPTCLCFCKQKDSNIFNQYGKSLSEADCSNTCQNAGLILLQCKQ